MVLAGCLNVPVRLVVPLDWDHVWTEYDQGSSSPSPSSSWQVHDGDARNFCRRLDEGIGSWAGVWAIHPDPDLCEDVTSDYLTCRRDGGRADNYNDDDDDDDDDDGMGRYKDAVRMAREDRREGAPRVRPSMDTHCRGRDYRTRILPQSSNSPHVITERRGGGNCMITKQIIMTAKS